MDRPTHTRQFGQVMLAHLDAAYNLARWLLHDPRVATEVVRDTCQVASRLFDASAGAGCDRTWLLGLVRTACHARLSGGDDPVAPVHQHASIDRAIAALPPTLRECIVLRDMEGLSYAAMARVIDAPIGTVLSRLVLARDAMRRETASTVA